MTPLDVTLEKTLRHGDAANVAADLGRVNVGDVQLQGTTAVEFTATVGTLLALGERKNK